MTSFMEKLTEAYHNIDPRTKDYVLTSTPLPIIIMISCYLYFCLSAGPRFMKGRQPYELKYIIMIYNFVQILINCYLSFYGTLVLLHVNLFCAPLEYSEDPINLQALSLCWLYVCAKLSELLDTVFFVLRKKFNQLTFLHIFHHTAMATLPWMSLRYIAGGHGIVFGLFNSYVHVVMYTYYLIANLGPQYRKYLWWKKYVTIMQLIQFGIIFVHNFIPLFTSCPYPKSFNLAICFFASFFFYMFSNFYVKTYVRKTKENGKNT